MIGNFPDSYPDELFYSICARFSERMRYSNGRSVVVELFGSASAIACVSLPSHLDHLVAQMPPRSSYSANGIIDNHTLLPFFAPFLPLERLDRLRRDMRGDRGSALHMRAGIMASRVPLPEWFRYCPQCVEDDRRRFGECYWHRIHQASGVELCPMHKVWLQNSRVRMSNTKIYYEFVSAECSIQETLLYQNDRNASLFEPLLALTLDIQWLLAQHHLSQKLRYLQRRYSKRLVHLGISTYRGRVDRNELLSGFKTMYTSDVLSLLHCELDENIEDCWLIRLIHKPDNAQHPLHHLLLIHYLGLTADMFFQLPTEDKPFGDGPWPCLNPACHHYFQLQIVDCHIKHSPNVSGKPIGAFSCKCGFVYCRTGPDTSTEDRLKIGRVKAFGYMWEAMLCRLWEDETVSLRQIALQLGVDPLTVKRHASRLGLLFPRPVARTCHLVAALKLRPSYVKIIETEVLEEYRKMWMNAVEEYQNMGVKFLRSKFPNVYTWLYRHDLAWLKSHLPSSKQESRSQSSRVDWQKRDRDLAELVEMSARRLKERAGRPVQITISAIGKASGQLALLQQHLHRLPITTYLLGDLLETRVAFALRRLEWTVEQYRKEKILPKRYELIKKAGLWRIASESRVKLSTEEALQFLQPSH